MTDDNIDEKWQTGAEKLADVYQGQVSVIPPGLMEFSDIMTRDLFGGIWTREQLDVAQRRLIVMGVIAAVGGPNTWKLQCKSALKRGELTEEQVREVLIQATPYVGYPRAAELVGTTEEAIAECRREAAGAPADSGEGDGTS
ncbi:MAG: carboxymuconolactone decarboxylase family protein [Acidimicrobiaceae bacterium]|nr:carboxymuconolactone decarboxylase family protein [Acidimicrobiaceae bacterium]MDE0606124.1 carboxymuconolactone decarboxylase family protein [Acidimicrobiaceae bacterium]